MQFTRKGYIEVLLDDVLISRHTAAEEAYESAYRHAEAHAEEDGNAVYVIRYPNRELDLGSLKKVRLSHSWSSTPVLNFVQGSASSVNLANYVSNPTQKTLTYSVYSGTLPTGCTLSGSTVSYNGTGTVATASVKFGASDGTNTAVSSTSTVRISTTIDTTAPSVPVLTATVATSTSISLSWTASTDNVGVAGYQLYRSTDNATWGSPIYDGTARTYTDTGRTANTLYYYRVRAYDAVLNYSGYGTASVTITDWLPFTGPTFTLGTPSNWSFATYAPSGATSFTLSPAVTGVSVDSANKRLVYDGTGSTGSYSGRVLSTNTAEADWLARSTATGVQVAENFSSYANRGEWMNYLRYTVEPITWTDAALVEPYYPNSIGGSANDPLRYADPIPEGAEEKLGLHTSTYLSGGKSAYLRLRVSEGATEAGPSFQIPFTPASKWYVQFAIRFDSEPLTHDYYGGSGCKIFFLNQLNFTSGQIVLNKLSGYHSYQTAWPIAYRVYSTGSSFFQNIFSTGPGSKSGDRQYYTAYDSGAKSGGGFTDATSENLWEQRYGFSYRNANSGDADFAAVPKFEADKWYVLTFYIDQDYVGSVSRGMFKMWMAEYGQQPQLLTMNYRDCRFPDYATLQMDSVRPVWRPEDATVGQTQEGGLYFDEIIVSHSPINFPGGYSLPYAGQEIPPWIPIANTVEG